MSHLKVELRGEVEILTLARPEVSNAVSPDMARELSEYFKGLQERLATRVVLLRGEGRHFCAGADLGSGAFEPAGPEQRAAVQRLFSGIPLLMQACPQPIIGLLHGAACGAGFSIALACDVRFAAPDARMNAAYLKVGLGGCDMGSGYLLPRLVGGSVAAELLLTARFIDAARALAVGLVSDVVAADALLETGLSMAREMLEASPMGLRMTKETLHLEADAPSLEAALRLEDRQQIILLAGEDHQRALRAFEEKRQSRN